MIISLFPVSSSCIDIKLLPTAIQNHTTVPLSIPNMAYKLLTRFFLSEDFGVTFSSSLYSSILLGFFFFFFFLHNEHRHVKITCTFRVKTCQSVNVKTVRDKETAY